MSKQVVLGHFFYWDKLPESEHEKYMHELVENGASYLVLPWELLLKFVRNEYSPAAFLQKAEKCGLTIMASHSPWGVGLSMNMKDCPERARMLEEQLTAMKIAADCGAKTTTVHVESGPYMNETEPVEVLIRKSTDRMIRTLEQLVPEAEKLDLIVAVENCFSPFNTAEVLLECVHAIDSPYIGCCYDAGHANYVRSGTRLNPGTKVMSKFPPWQLENIWHGDVWFDDYMLEKLKPHIVTCHLHDNDGYDDQHQIPGRGNIDWQWLVPELLSCPRLFWMQNESKIYGRDSSIQDMCGAFRKALGGYGILGV